MSTVLMIGQGPTSLSALESLAEQFEVAGVIRTPESDDDPVAALANSRGIPLLPDTSLKALEAAIQGSKPDCVVISSYHRIIPGRLISLCPFVNVHYSPLPRYRGRANVNWAILNGEPYTAISIHTVDPGLDSGSILFQKIVPIHDRATVTELYDALNRIQLCELGNTITRFLNGYRGLAQAREQATYCCTRTPEDGEIDWNEPAVRIDRLIRALQSPFPGAYTYFDGRRIQIWKAEPVLNAPAYVGRIPGRVILVNRQSGAVDVLTGGGALRISEVQCGETRMPAASLITSTKQTLGLRISDLLRRIEELEKRSRQDAAFA